VDAIRLDWAWFFQTLFQTTRIRSCSRTKIHLVKWVVANHNRGPATHDLSAEIEALARGQTIENHDIKKDSDATRDRNEVVAVETISE
jgi:hypothetical protein